MTFAIRYKYGRASPEAQALIVGSGEHPNAMMNKRRLALPFDKMRVGDSLLFHYAELLEWEWRNARASARRVNNELGYEMLACVKHETMLEIVRIA